jgi:hypothetical protein
MHAKLINPKTNGKKAYNNQGSAAQALNYLTHEARKDGHEARFFDGQQDTLGREDLLAALDNNVKGLRATEAKFYSLVLSPSPEELAHIGGGDEAKLRAYTREVMAAYAAGFRLKDGGAVDQEDRRSAPRAAGPHSRGRVGPGPGPARHPQPRRARQSIQSARLAGGGAGGI